MQIERHPKRYMLAAVKELERPLARPGTPIQRRNAIAKKLGLVLAVLALVVFVVSRLNLSRDLHRLDARILSGETEGSYFAVVADLGRIAQKGKGKIENVPSNGTADNIARLGKPPRARVMSNSRSHKTARTSRPADQSSKWWRGSGKRSRCSSSAKTPTS